MYLLTTPTEKEMAGHVATIGYSKLPTAEAYGIYHQIIDAGLSSILSFTYGGRVTPIVPPILNSYKTLETYPVEIGKVFF